MYIINIYFKPDILSTHWVLRKPHRYCDRQIQNTYICMRSVCTNVWCFRVFPTLFQNTIPHNINLKPILLSNWLDDNLISVFFLSFFYFTFFFILLLLLFYFVFHFLVPESMGVYCAKLYENKKRMPYEFCQLKMWKRGCKILKLN